MLMAIYHCKRGNPCSFEGTQEAQLALVNVSAPEEFSALVYVPKPHSSTIAATV
jgi:hypothetical protein